jgi:hypothetical protein
MPHRMDLRFAFEMSYLKRHRTVTDLPPKPPRFRPRSGKLLPLPVQLKRELGPLHAALGLHRLREAGPLGLEGLATIAHYTLGLMRYEPTDPYPLHRPVPSPRCLYASELSYVSLKGAVLPPGVYRYHPAWHCLEEQALPSEGFLERCFAEVLEGASEGWLLSCVVDRIAHLYGKFAVRLAMLEAGHLISQLRLVSRALGVGTKVRPWIGHPEVSRWMGEDEVPLALISCGQPAESPQRAGGEEKAAAVPRPWLETGLRQAMLRRNSGHGPSGVYPVVASLCAADLSGLAWYALEESLEDAPSEELRLALYLVVLHSVDARRGVYRWRARERELEWLYPTPSEQEVARTLFSSPGFAVQNCPVAMVVAADVRGAWQRWGQEGYFRVLEQAGRAAQRVGLAAAALELFARPAVSLEEAATDRLLGLHVARETAVYSVLVGKDRERGLPVRLAL